jgi:hypothetical protein
MPWAKMLKKGRGGSPGRLARNDFSDDDDVIPRARRAVIDQEDEWPLDDGALLPVQQAIPKFSFRMGTSEITLSIATGLRVSGSIKDQGSTIKDGAAKPQIAYIQISPTQAGRYCEDIRHG